MTYAAVVAKGIEYWGHLWLGGHEGMVSMTLSRDSYEVTWSRTHKFEGRTQPRPQGPSMSATAATALGAYELLRDSLKEEVLRAQGGK